MMQLRKDVELKRISNRQRLDLTSRARQQILSNFGDRAELKLANLNPEQPSVRIPSIQDIQGKTLLAAEKISLIFNQNIA
jgi:hypothetical protein